VDICAGLKNEDYADIFITTAAEMPGVLLTAFIIERLGRKKTLAIDLTAASLFWYDCLLAHLNSFLLFICSGRIAETIFLFCIRAFSTGAFQVPTMQFL